MKKRTDLPDWSDLRFFVEAARTGSLSAAARSLGVTHATVSRRIIALEAVLGHALFERRLGRYTLTEQGERILSLAGEMEERALAIARVAAAGCLPAASGPVRITTTDAFGARFLTPQLHHLLDEHPGLEIEMVIDNRNLRLAWREADLAIRFGRSLSPEITAIKIADIAYYTYASAEYASSKRVETKRYLGYSAEVSSLPEAEYVAQKCNRHDVRLRTNSWHVRLAAVRAGLGLGLLPRFVGETEPLLVRFNADEVPLLRELWLMVHADLQSVPRVVACIDFITSLAERERNRLGAIVTA